MGLIHEAARMLLEGIQEKAVIDLLRKTIEGSEFDGKLYIAGGHVRDEILGKDSKDIDILVGIDGDLTAGIRAAEFIAEKLGLHPPVTFPRFGTAQLKLKDIEGHPEIEEMDVEFVAPRKEQYPDPRKPVVSAGTLKDDAERRDFTINSLLKNLTSGEILDLTGMGIDDLKRGVVRTAIDPDKIFKDDPLRLLRAVRFAMKYDFQLPQFMRRSMKKNARMLEQISAERIRDELNKMLLTKQPSRAIRMLKITGLLPYVSKEVEDLVGITQGPQHSGDAFKHTMSVLDASPPELIRRLAALFHDIGKKAARTEEDGKIRFIGHEEAGAALAGEILRRLSYPNAVIDQVKKIITLHMKLKQGGKEAETLKDKTLRKFVHQAADVLEPLLDVIHADNMSHSPEHRMERQIAKVKERLAGWNIEDIVRAELPVDGHDIMALGAKGKDIGRVMTRLREKWLEHGSLDRATAIRIAKDMLGSKEK